MNTLGNKTKTKVTLEESYILAKSFASGSDLVRGQQVKLNADGTISAITAATEKPFGNVVKGCKTGEYTTVMTDFKAVLTSVADGDVATADELSVSSFDATEGNDNYIKSTAGDFVSAIALSDAIDGEYVEVGILRSPYKL